jgi:hypothetical protein
MQPTIEPNSESSHHRQSPFAASVHAGQRRSAGPTKEVPVRSDAWLWVALRVAWDQALPPASTRSTATAAVTISMPWNAFR